MFKKTLYVALFFMMLSLPYQVILRIIIENFGVKWQYFICLTALNCISILIGFNIRRASDALQKM